MVQKVINVQVGMALRLMEPEMKRWRWVPGAAIALAVYLLLNGLAAVYDVDTGVTVAVAIIATALVFKALDRPEK